MTLGTDFARAATIGMLGFGSLQLAIPSLPAALAVDLLVIAACVASMRAAAEWAIGESITIKSADK